MKASKKITSESIVFDARFLKIRKLDIHDPLTNETHGWFCMDRGDSVAALVYDRTADEYLFVKQFRAGSRSELIELVAGALDVAGEDPAAAMEREINEELGVSVQPGTLRKLFSFFASPGALSERMTLYYAEAGERLHAGGGVHDERIEIVRFKRKELQPELFADAKTIIGVQWLLARHG